MTNNGPSYVIESEKLWSKKATKFTTRKQISDFDNYEPILVRNSQEKFLADDISIVIAKNKEDNEQSIVTSLLGFTNVNVLPFNEDIPLEIIKYFDPSIEYLYFEKDERNSIHLKFKGKSELLLFNPIDLNKYLSSGTIRGIFLFYEALNTLQNGGYVIVDELEKHFNKEIVCTIIRIFKSIKLNINGATLIYTTHYPELLNEYDRNDNIFITKNQDGISVENLSFLLKRNDIKKSEAYQSGYLKGTTPSYNSYIELKRKFESILASNKVE